MLETCCDGGEAGRFLEGVTLVTLVGKFWCGAGEKNCPAPHAPRPPTSDYRVPFFLCSQNHEGVVETTELTL